MSYPDEQGQILERVVAVNFSKLPFLKTEYITLWSSLPLFYKRLLHPRLDSTALSCYVNRVSWIISANLRPQRCLPAWMQHLEAIRLRSSRSVNTGLSGA